LGIFAALADALAFVAVPGAGFLYQVLVHSQINHVALTRDAFAVHNVKLSFAEGSSSLVLDHFNFGTRTDNHIAIFNGGNTADIHANGRIKFEGAATGRGLRIAEHHANLLSNLVDENQAGP